jgi:hypothetical protein
MIRGGALIKEPPITCTTLYTIVKISISICQLASSLKSLISVEIEVRETFEIQNIR